MNVAAVAHDLTCQVGNLCRRTNDQLFFLSRGNGGREEASQENGKARCGVEKGVVSHRSDPNRVKRTGWLAGFWLAFLKKVYSRRELNPRPTGFQRTVRKEKGAIYGELFRGRELPMRIEFVFGEENFDFDRRELQDFS